MELPMTPGLERELQLLHDGFICRYELIWDKKPDGQLYVSGRRVTWVSPSGESWTSVHPLGVSHVR